MNQALIDAAVKAREFACAPRSGFKVGAALECDDGTIITGCNVENATLSLTTCAERCAIVKAVSEGKRRFRRVAVATVAPKPTPPCGSCRQLLWEFGGNMEVLIVNDGIHVETYRLAELFPKAFDGSNL